MSLDAKTIFAAQDLAMVEVPCPEWGGSIHVRKLRGRERDAYETFIARRRGKKDEADNADGVMAYLVMLAACDADGKRLFQDCELENLQDKAATALQRIWQAASDLNGFSKASQEELAKNS